jgi:hypothetical protein
VIGRLHEFSFSARCLVKLGEANRKWFSTVFEFRGLQRKFRAEAPAGSPSSAELWRKGSTGGSLSLAGILADYWAVDNKGRSR